MKSIRMIAGFIVMTILSCDVWAHGPETIIYQSVYAPNISDASNRRIITVEKDQRPSPFLIEGDHLYLPIQSSRTKWWLFVEVDRYEWSVERLQRLAAKHPTVAGLLPDQHAKNGGIKWIPFDSENVESREEKGSVEEKGSEYGSE